jgi:hypothetical protein
LGIEMLNEVISINLKIAPMAVNVNNCQDWVASYFDI